MTDRFETKWHGIGACGSIALDFVNTLDWRLRPEPVELFHAYTDVLRWAWTAGVMNLSEAKSLRIWTQAHPRKTSRALAGALELREAVAALFQARVHEQKMPVPALAVLERAHHSATRARALQPEGRTVEWTWRDPKPGIERVEWAVALESVRLLTTPDGDRIRQCADAHCGWFFLDTSRNRSRRWCSMEACGNRNKVRSFYRRSNSAPGQDGDST